MANVRVEGVGKNTHVFVNNIEIPCVTSVTFFQTAEEVPSFNIEVSGDTSFEINDADVDIIVNSDSPAEMLKRTMKYISGNYEYSLKMCEFIYSALMKTKDAKEVKKTWAVFKGIVDGVEKWLG